MISFVPFVPVTFMCTANGAVPEVGEVYIVAVGGVSLIGGMTGGVIISLLGLWQLENINGIAILTTNVFFIDFFSFNKYILFIIIDIGSVNF